MAEEDIPKEVSSKFFDDISGTEYGAGPGARPLCQPQPNPPRPDSVKP